MKAIVLAATLAAALAAAATPVSAALSGYWDSAKVIHAILGSAQVADALRQQPVERIERTQDGYRLHSRHCRVDVRVTRTAADRPGPGSFGLGIGRGDCA